MSSPVPSLRRRPEADRHKIHAGLVAVCRERGFGKATIQRVVERAGLDDATFGQHFVDLDDCFAEYLVDVCTPLIEGMTTAMETTQSWRTQLRAVIYEMVRFFRADQDRAHMVLVETLAGGPRSRLLRDQALEAMVDLIDRGRLQTDDPMTLSRVSAEALAGGLAHQLQLLHLEERRDEVDELVPSLMYLLVLPYLGLEAAVDELSNPLRPEP